MNLGNGHLYTVRIETGATFAPVVEAGLELLGRQMVTWHEDDAKRVTFEEYITDRDAAERRVRELTRHLEQWSAGEAWRVDIHLLPAEGWQDRWKEHFHAARVSRRVVVKPSWEEWASGDDDVVVELDPGMSFGTGLHPTTRACLRFLDQLADERPGCSFLDVGCGSGILTIAAVKLGFSAVTAIDHDPESVATTRLNLERNGVGEGVACCVADLAGWRSERVYDAVVANMLADILSSHAPGIVGAVSPDPPGDLFLSGALAGQYEAVKEIYQARGTREAASTTHEGWTSGRFKWVGPPAPG